MFVRDAVNYLDQSISNILNIYIRWYGNSNVNIHRSV
jgi:hypothetical protein